MNSQISVSKLFLSVLLAITISFSFPIIAMAMSLQHAKEMGVVGETKNGYLGIVNSAAPAAVKAMVADVNRKRKTKYREIAGRNKTSVAAVEKLAGKKTISKTPTGQYIQSKSGKWVKK